jgi:hypothetical protein
MKQEAREKSYCDGVFSLSSFIYSLQNQLLLTETIITTFIGYKETTHDFGK